MTQDDALPALPSAARYEIVDWSGDYDGPMLTLVLNVSFGSAHCWKWNPGSIEPWSSKASNHEKMAAVRRAIVREAAALAKLPR
jgi:hypothetical protein